MVAWLRWRSGRDDLGPFVVLAVPMLLWAILAGPRGFAVLVGVVVSLGLALATKHLLPPGGTEDLSLAPPVVALLVELTILPLTVGALLLAAAAGVGLLLWVGTDPASGVPWGATVEPALVPALAVAVAVAVMLFLPGGTGGQVGIAALVLVGVLGLSAWLYLQSAAEVNLRRATP